MSGKEKKERKLTKKSFGVTPAESTMIFVTKADRSKLIRRIEEIEAGLSDLSIEGVMISAMSKEDILKYTVCEVTSDNIEGVGGVNDPIMGTVDNNTLCITCAKTIQSCPGHPGHIKLSIPILNPIFTNIVVYVLRSVCNSCGALLLTDDQMHRKGFDRMSGFNRLQKIAEETTRGGASTIQCTRHVEDPEHNITACKLNPTFSSTKSSDPNSIEYSVKISGVTTTGNKTAKDIKDIFDNISPETARQLGFMDGSHPRNIIMEYLVVIPPRARPNTTQKGVLIVDPLTQMYKEIVRCNNALKNPDISESDRISIGRTLVTKVRHLVNNSDGTYRIGGKSEPSKGIVQKIQGKKAVIRKTAMGKRGDFTARSVIGPDPSLRFGQVGVPMAIAKVLTKPVVVTAFNIDELQTLMANGKINNITPKYGPGAGHRKIAREGYVLQPGDIVERHLMNGDIILMGRQPTLHKHSMTACEVVLRDSLAIGIHMSQTTPHGADFDGDEMWLVMPQTIESQVELENVVSFRKNIITGAKSAPVVGAVYDALVGLYLLTRNEKEFVIENGVTVTKYANPEMDVSFFNDCYMAMTNLPPLDEFDARCNKYNLRPRCGRALFSLALPDTFEYDQNGIVIKEGILIKGEITSKTVGSGVPNSIHHVIALMYNYERACDFLTDITMLGERYATVYGLTIGIKDCIFSKEGLKEVDLAVKKAKANVEEIELQEYSDPLLEARREGRILEALDIVKSVATKVTEKELDEDNRFVIMSKSGGKGNLPGVTQISGIVGQQLIENKRFDPVLPGNRTLPWFPTNDKDPVSRGFCTRSFFEGLEPSETFFHAATGRASLVDMGIKTADTGALQRISIKATEDLVTQYDGTVRNGGGVIIQFLYGDDSFTTEKTSRVKYGYKEFETLFNIHQLVLMANAEYLREIGK